MNTINTKRFSTQYGDLEYYQALNLNQEVGILFIHGLAQTKEWFKEQYSKYNLAKFSWIVPDLLGHGNSAKPKNEFAYSMENQASMLYDLLIEEKINRIVIIGHSMGGPIAISLLEQIQNNSNQKTSNIEILGLFYLEGNLDRGDATFSSKIAEYSLDEFETQFESYLLSLFTEFGSSIQSFCDELRVVGPYPLCASCKDLAHQSYTNELLPRLQKCLQFPVYFVFGEENKGKLSSEDLVKAANLPVIYIPKVGHDLVLANPSDFWSLIKELIPK